MNSYNRKEVEKQSQKYFKNDNLMRDVWINKYALKDSDDNIYELTPDDMHNRIASELHRMELKYPNPLSYTKIYDLIKDFKYIVPQGGPMSGIGNTMQTVSLSNCFVVGNDHDSYGGIMNIDQEQVQLMKRRGGVGHDLSHIRPKGSPVKNSALTSTGVVPFMERFSNSTREVAQDGRRGALMLSISIEHPDSEDFIDAKMTQGKVTGANVSVRINDEFMNCVLEEKPYTQKFPIGSDEPKYSKEVDAKKIWKKIVHNAWKSAEPGILFWDTVKRESIPDMYSEHGFTTTSTNPCFPSSEYLLTERGYISFGDGYKYNKPLSVITDNRISYVDDGGDEKPEKWKINTEKSGVSIRNASKVKLTQPMSDVIEIITKHGFVVKLTPDHHVATKNGMIEAKDLQPDDDILISIPSSNGSIIGKLPETEEEISAYLIGLIAGDGTFDKLRKRLHIDFWGDDKERMKNIVTDLIDKLYEINGDILNDRNRKLSKYFITEIEENDKIRISSAWLSFYLDDKYGFNRKTKFNVPKFVYNNARLNIGKFYLSSLFYCDGTVTGSKRSGYTIRLSQSNKDFLTEIQRIAHANGIIMGLYKRRDKSRRNFPNGKGGYSLYDTKECYELITIGGSIVRYREAIGFNGDIIKEEKMLIEHNFRIKDSFYDNIVEVNECDPEPVYCIQEKETRSIIVNGISTRRCGEIPLCPYDSCRLLAINLYSYVVNPFKDDAYFDFDLFSEHVGYAQRFMDDIVDLEIEKVDAIIKKIKDDPEDEEIKRVEINLWEKIKEKSIQGRRTGLGITAEGDMLASLGYKYGTKEATDFAVDVHKTLALNAYKSSIQMAKERGSFDVWDYEKEFNSPFIQRIWALLDEEHKKMYIDFGRRNIALLTIAPTGSVSIMTQTTSGIEPVFLPVYTRRRKINPNDKNVTVSLVDEVGDSWEEYNVFHPKFKIWAEINGYDVDELEKMKTSELQSIIEKSPYFGASSNDVDWLEKVQMQGRIQQWVDHSISVTVNLPKDATEDLVGSVYEAGWKNECKGITVYRDGSRSGVLVSKSEAKPNVFQENNAPRRPKILQCDVIRFTNKGEKWIGFLGLLDNRPYEIFTGLQDSVSIPNYIEVGEILKQKNAESDGHSRYDLKYIDKDGYPQEFRGLSRAFNREFWNTGRLVSGILRHGMPLPNLMVLLDKLDFGDSDMIASWRNGVKRMIKKYIKDGTKISGEECPQCHSHNIVYKEGCKTCLDCQWSKCD